MKLNKLKKAFSLFSYFWGILSGKYRVQFIFIFFAILISSMLETIGVSVIIPFINAILTPEKLMQNKYVSVFLKILHKHQDRLL